MHVAKELHVPRLTAARWVARAHILGFLDSIKGKVVVSGGDAEPWHSVCFRPEQGPPFVRYSGAGTTTHTAWVSCPPDIDLDHLVDTLANDAAMRGSIRRQGVVPAVVEHLGLSLSPLEKDLMTRFAAHDTGSGFWRSVRKAGLDAEEYAQEIRERAPQDYGGDD